jgi:hypothetical protein
VAGRAKDLLRVVEYLDILEEEDDQAVLSGLLHYRPDMIVLDYRQELLGNSRYWLGMEGGGCPYATDTATGRLAHEEYGTQPLFLHTSAGFYECHVRLAADLGVDGMPSIGPDGLSQEARRLQYGDLAIDTSTSLEPMATNTTTTSGLLTTTSASTGSETQTHSITSTSASTSSGTLTSVTGTTLTVLQLAESSSSFELATSTTWSSIRDTTESSTLASATISMTSTITTSSITLFTNVTEAIDTKPVFSTPEDETTTAPFTSTQVDPSTPVNTSNIDVELASVRTIINGSVGMVVSSPESFVTDPNVDAALTEFIEVWTGVQNSGFSSNLSLIELGISVPADWSPEVRRLSSSADNPSLRGVVDMVYAITVLVYVNISILIHDMASVSSTQMTTLIGQAVNKHAGNGTYHVLVINMSEPIVTIIAEMAASETSILPPADGAGAAEFISAAVGSDAYAVAGFQIHTLGDGKWYRQHGAVILWLFLLFHALVALVARMRGVRLQRHVDRRGGGEQSLAERPTACRWQEMCEAADRQGRHWCVPALLSFVTNVVKIDVDCEAYMKKSIIEGFVTGLAVKCLEVSVFADLGFADTDLRHLAGGNVPVAALLERSTSKRQVCDTGGCSSPARVPQFHQRFAEALERKQDRLLAGDWRAQCSEYLTLFRVAQPVLRLLLYSAGVHWSHRILAWAATSLSLLASSALLLGLPGAAFWQADASQVVGACLLPSGQHSESVMRMHLGVVCLAIVVAFLPGAFLFFWRIGEAQEGGPYASPLVIVLAIAFCGACLLAVALFFANGCPGDADHWLFCATLALMVHWLLLPCAASLASFLLLRSGFCCPCCCRPEGLMPEAGRELRAALRRLEAPAAGADRVRPAKLLAVEEEKDGPQEQQEGEVEVPWAWCRREPSRVAAFLAQATSSFSPLADSAAQAISRSSPLAAASPSAPGLRLRSSPAAAAAGGNPLRAGAKTGRQGSRRLLHVESPAESPVSESRVGGTLSEELQRVGMAAGVRWARHPSLPTQQPTVKESCGPNERGLPLPPCSASPDLRLIAKKCAEEAVPEAPEVGRPLPSAGDLVLEPVSGDEQQ